MSKKVYDKIRDLDPRDASIKAILEAYKAAVGPNWNRPIDDNHAKLIYETAMQDQAMDPLEAEALDLILDNAIFGSGTKHKFESLVESNAAQNAFIAGSTLPWKNSELGRVTDALDMGNVGRIHFRNPVTQRVLYTPRHYQVVRTLIEKKRITVRKTAATFVGYRLMGFYASSQNQLVLNTQGDLFDAQVIYHATIAIQDWYDLVTLNKFSIADGSIAEAVARKEMGMEKRDGALGKALGAAVKLVLDKGSPALDAANKRWAKAYNEVVKAIETDAFTKTTANDRADFVEDPTKSVGKEQMEFTNEYVNMKP